MPHPMHHARVRDDLAEELLEKHHGAEGHRRDKLEEERRAAETHHHAEMAKHGDGRRHRVRHPSAASPAAH